MKAVLERVANEQEARTDSETQAQDKKQAANQGHVDDETVRMVENPVVDGRFRCVLQSEPSSKGKGKGQR